MKLTSKKVIKQLFKKHLVRPEKRLGQRFLIDKRVFQKVIGAANLRAADVVLEIGPGIGNLTLGLAKKVRKVIAIEKDPKLVRILKDELRIKNIKNVEVIEGDIRQIPDSKFKIQNSYKVVANLPFNIASLVIRKFLESNNQPRVLVLVVQKEVAQRICAHPPTTFQKKGSNKQTKQKVVGGRPPKMNLLAVSVQFYAKPQIISYVSKKSSWPQPKVDSAIIKITPKKILWRSDLHNLFFRIVKAGFSQPRKQISNNLAKKLRLEKEKVVLWLEKNKIKPEQRAENLSLGNWFSLTKSLNFFNEL